ncbi:hypothetical protein B5C34_04560 [Pacificimonas flava]|uniref:Uncharacterized protein n=2 Tax=Pacificimonas TaxID=1960290 RepID=A0A219B384_9SPHN|nr:MULTISPECIES: YjgN family protein [Pacificimonas]MBZ6377510.1 DUF898 domain-containing protein [Pacificimonas aurantium]OWV32795.1 hypothetical protein B5C34_04560 [Pacificimonas flava]
MMRGQLVERDFERPEKGLYPGIEFHGHWREFLPIVATNLILTLVTLGIYRFWAKARERSYLWSRTQFIDDRLEWTGTGKEMFLGFLIVLAVLVPAGAVFQVLVSRGGPVIALIGVLLIYAGFFYLIGVARFRALRYRVSRTRWHGLRGGSEEGGWSYGVTAIVMSLLTGFTLGLAYPAAQVSLWSERWGKMQYGDAPVSVTLDKTPPGLFGRWLLIYGAFICLYAVLFGSFFAGMSASPESSESWILVTVVLFTLGFYFGLPLLFVVYYAKFMRSVIGEMSWMGVDLRFTASTLDWIKLYLGHALLVLVTLGFGLLFIGYRNWAFFVRHLEASGTIDPDAIRQSELRMRTDAEGLAEAFDIGGI